MIESAFYRYQKPSLTEVLGELLPVYDLELYEEIGRGALDSNNMAEAQKWFTRGLSMAREQGDSEKIELFRVLVLASL